MGDQHPSAWDAQRAGSVAKPAVMPYAMAIRGRLNFNDCDRSVPGTGLNQGRDREMIRRLQRRGTWRAPASQNIWRGLYFRELVRIGLVDFSCEYLEHLSLEPFQSLLAN